MKKFKPHPGMSCGPILDAAIVRFKQAAAADDWRTPEGRHRCAAIVLEIQNNDLYELPGVRALAKRSKVQFAYVRRLARFATTYSAEAIQSAKSRAQLTGASLSYSTFELLSEIRDGELRQELLDTVIREKWPVSKLRQKLRALDAGLAVTVTGESPAPADAEKQATQNSNATYGLQELEAVCKTVCSGGPRWKVQLNEALVQGDDAALRTRETMALVFDALMTLRELQESGAAQPVEA